MPARITDGCGPTASTYAPIEASEASSAASRGIAGEQREPERAERDHDDVAAADGEQVIEAARAEALPQRVGEALVLAEHDALEHAAPLARSPGAPPRASQACSRSATPPRPPRRPTMRQADARSTAWTPWRRSQVRSSKPFDGPRGARRTPSSESSAPCGGARPSGSSSSTGSRGRSAPQRRTSARMRSSKAPLRGGSSTWTSARSAVPMRGASTLRSIRRGARCPSPSRRGRARPRRRRAARGARRRRGEGRRGGGEQGGGTTDARRRRGREPGAERAGEEVRQPKRHGGITSPFSSAIRDGPMPGTASSSATAWNGPCALR